MLTLNEIDTFQWLLVIVIILLLLLAAWFHTFLQSPDPLRYIPGPKPYPIIGNVYEMFQIEAVELFLGWCKQYGKIFKYTVFLLGTQVMVSDADALKHIMVTNNQNYKKPESLLIPVRKIFGSRCLICLSPHEHADRRKMLNPAFNTASISSKAVSILSNTEKLMAVWLKNEPSSVIQVQDDLTRLSLDILGNCVFGYDFNCIENPGNKLTNALYRLMTVQDMNVMRFLPFYKYLPTRMNADLRLIRNLVKGIIKNKEANASGETQVDMLDLMLQSRNITGKSGTQLTDNDIVDDIILFLIAGHETATNVLCWVLLELSKHPQMQKKCRNEAKSITQHGSLSYDLSSKLVYTECCLKEALRLYPPVPLTLRQAIRDDTLGSYFIPAGTVVALQVAATMRHEDYFADGAKFFPERFLASDPPKAHHFIPFLAGPDMCIGMKFAMLEMKLILAKILLNVEFRHPDDVTFHGCQGLTYHMEPSLYLIGNLVSPRQKTC